MYGRTIHVRRDILLSVTGVIVNKYVDLSMSDCKEKLPSDCIYGYAKELLTLVLFYSEYSNAIRGGDGASTCIAMVVLLVPLFKAANQTNYTIEAFSSFKQRAFLLPS